MRVYLSGPMSGLDDNVSRAIFDEGVRQISLRELTPVNPWNILPGKCDNNCEMFAFTHSWECWMKGDIRELVLCDAIAMLPGWRDSRGARLEYMIAAGLGLTVIMLDVTSEEEVLIEGAIT